MKILEAIYFRPRIKKYASGEYGVMSQLRDNNFDIPYINSLPRNITRQSLMLDSHRVCF